MLSLLFTLVLVGVILYAVNTLVPMDPKIRTLVNLVVVVLAILWVAQAFGVWTWSATRWR